MKELEAITEDKNPLGKEPIGKLLFRMVLPTVTAQLINLI